MSSKEASKSTQELLARIRDLEIENMELKSKLDQYQSVFPATGGPPIGGPGASPPAAAPTERKVAHGPQHPREIDLHYRVGHEVTGQYVCPNLGKVLCC